MPTFSTLCLGSRKDADQWRKGMKDKLGFTESKFVKHPEPSLAELKGFFGASDDWLYVAGHFSSVNGWPSWPYPNESRLYNDIDNDATTPPTAEILFRSGNVLCRRKSGSSWAESLLVRGDGFKQNAKAKVVIWGGCSVGNPNTVGTMQALFGPAVIVAFAGETGWQILDVMMGGYGDSSGSGWKTPNFWDKLGSNSGDLVAVRDAWLETAGAITWGSDILSRFRVFDPDGTEHQA